MSVEKQVIVTRRCDLCRNVCDQSESHISIQVSPGDGRDVGPSTMYGFLYAQVPYVDDQGDICETCKLKWLESYVARERERLEREEKL